MTHPIRSLLVSAALATAALYAAPAFAGDDAKAGASAAADTRVPTPPAGKGQIVFFRPFGPGMALSFSVHEGNTGISKLGAGTYAVYVADPGPHTLAIQSETTDTLRLEVDAGETYYVKETIGMGLVVGRPHLTLSDAASFAKFKGHESTQKPTDLKP